jgi:hypothetical protein
LLAALWLSPLASLPFESKRHVFAVAVLMVSLVFQGPPVVYFGILLVSFGICLHGFVGGPTTLMGLLRSNSYLFLLSGLGLGSAIIFARLSRTRSNGYLLSLKSAVAQTEKSHERLLLIQDNVQLTRERLLGRTRSSGESLLGDLKGEGESLVEAVSSVSFDVLIFELRKSFSEYQISGRAEGRIAGPIRFVFFAPVAGYDEKAKIGVDLTAMRRGVESCLTLALESLPEIGSRKREGVVRLSIRFGLHFVEVAIEDNGRGLTSRNLETENSLGALKELVVNWGGKFDRFARLGVGSRTSFELRILREARRSASAAQFNSIGSQSEVGPRA